MRLATPLRRALLGAAISAVGPACAAALAACDGDTTPIGADAGGDATIDAGDASDGVDANDSGDARAADGGSDASGEGGVCPAVAQCGACDAGTVCCATYTDDGSSITGACLADCPRFPMRDGGVTQAVMCLGQTGATGTYGKADCGERYCVAATSGLPPSCRVCN